MLYQHDSRHCQRSQPGCLATCQRTYAAGTKIISLGSKGKIISLGSTKRFFQMNYNLVVLPIPGQVKLDHLSAIVVVDFSKVGTLTTASLNKLCTLMSKIITRNPQCFFVGTLFHLSFCFELLVGDWRIVRTFFLTAPTSPRPQQVQLASSLPRCSSELPVVHREA